MSPTGNIDVAAKAMVEELTRACAAHLGAEATSAPADVPAASGWTLTVPVTGAAEGRLVIWFDRASAAAYVRTVAGTPEGEAAPADDAIADRLVELVHEAAAAVSARPDGAGIEIGAPVVGQGSVSAGARAQYVAVANVASCLIAVGVARPAVSRSSDDRLGAVLDVDLPLVVRFGRTIMPLHAVAELGPGSIIDLGRAPEEPVDLLVGDRVIARGEVVVVGGNYGVRITQLAAGREPGMVDREASAI
jgi:flagellar motor switch protein FliN/FliY